MELRLHSQRAEEDGTLPEVLESFGYISILECPTLKVKPSEEWSPH